MEIVELAVDTIFKPQCLTYVERSNVLTKAASKYIDARFVWNALKALALINLLDP